MIATFTPELTAHPFARKFPPLSEKDRAALKADIQSNGQLHPVVINRQNQILDGRHRYEIVRELGLEPRVVRFADVIGDKPVSEIEFVFASNFHRRHLSDDQRVALYAEFLPQLRKEAQANVERTLIHGRARGGAPIRNRRPGNDPPPKKGGVRVKLADLAGVGPGKSQRAIKIADHDPELLGQVSRGERTLGSAFHELTDPEPAPDTEPPPLKPVEVEALERKIDLWIVRFLAKFDRAQRVEILRLIADFCRTRIEKLT
jgi:hypothetical protein